MLLRQSFDELKNSNQHLEGRIKELEYENATIINHLNAEIKTIIQWIDTYLGVYFDSKNDIVELPNTISNFLKNRIRIDALKESLSFNQKKIHEELYKWDYQVKELVEENTNLNYKLEKLSQEYAEMRNELIERQNESLKFKHEYEVCSKQLYQNGENLNFLNENINNEKARHDKFLNSLKFSIREIYGKIKDISNEVEFDLLNEMQEITVYFN